MRVLANLHVDKKVSRIIFFLGSSGATKAVPPHECLPNPPPPCSACAVGGLLFQNRRRGQQRGKRCAGHLGHGTFLRSRGVGVVTDYRFAYLYSMAKQENVTPLCKIFFSVSRRLFFALRVGGVVLVRRHR